MTKEIKEYDTNGNRIHYRAWHLEQDLDEYRDYVLSFPDVNGYGGALRLSFCLESGTAYMTLTLDNQDGDRFVDGEQVVNSVPLEWANAVAAGVDGWTLPPPLDK